MDIICHRLRVLGGANGGGQSNLFKSLDRNVSSLNSTRSRWSDSETGGGGGSSAGGTGITTPYNPSMSLRASLGFRQQQQKQMREEIPPNSITDDGEEGQQHGEGQEGEEGEEMQTEPIDNGRERPVHVPGHPNHSHPGSSAIVADLQYQKEEAQRMAMLRHDSSLSTLPDES